MFFWNSCFFNDPANVGNLTSGSSAFSKTSLNIWKFTVCVLLKPGLENFEHYFTSVCGECNCNDGIYFMFALPHIVLRIEHVLFKSHNCSINNGNPLCRTTLVAQLIKNPPAMERPQFNSWVGEINWRREQVPIPVFLPGEFQGQMRLQSMGSQRI